mmetsp:Transcript_24295/g.75926  ORF Transcript_24295/g.75926 Transcript_24295/m.75926 type:complete len:202 (+) Transcript_24295:77-682(+)
MGKCRRREGSRGASLEDAEDFLDVERLVDGRFVGQDVEADGLSQGAALADGDDVAFLDVLEAGRAVDRHVLVPFLEAAVLAAPVQVVAADHDRALHLGGDDHALEDAAADRDVPGEGALLVDVVPLDRRLGGLEAEADVSDVSHALLAALRERPLPTDEDGILLLVGLLGLVRLAVLVPGRRHCFLFRAATHRRGPTRESR